MTDEEFDAFLAKVQDELESKQAELNSTYGLGEMKRWWFEQEGATLQFFDRNDRLAVEADVIGIGSFSLSPAVGSGLGVTQPSYRNFVRERFR